MTDRIVYLNSELFYTREGTGSKTILMFHGFGQDHLAFESWHEVLQTEYTVYSFDLFFHGHSRWENQQALTKDDWKKIMQGFFDQEKIDRFEIAGFSIGARFALTTVALFPQQTQRMMLLAPDGIHPNFWYRLATSTSLMRSLFRAVVLHPGPLQGLIQFVKLFHLENKNLLRFAELQLGTNEKRQRVYRTWIYFRHLSCRLKDLTQILNSSGIQVIFILGKSDEVIPAEKIKAFANTLRNQQFQLLRAGHPDLIRKAVMLIGKPLNEI